nr:exocyst complex component EXO70A1-like [Ipomoea trifida]
MKLVMPEIMNEPQPQPGSVGPFQRGSMVGIFQRFQIPDFSTMEPPGNDAVAFESAEKIVLRWDSTTSEEAREKMISEGDRQEINQYLQAVDEIQRSMESTTLLDDNQSKANSAI